MLRLIRRLAPALFLLCGAVPAATAQDRWIYDMFPTLGVVAFVWNDAEAAILSVGCTGGDGISGQPLAIRAGGPVLSSSIPADQLAAAPGPFAAQGSATATLIFDDGPQGAIVLRGRAYYPYLEAMGDRCSLGIDRLRDGSKVALVAGTPAEGDPSAPPTFSTPDGAITLTKFGDVKPPLAAIIMSLRGSSAALDRVLAACPAAQLPTTCPPP